MAGIPPRAATPKDIIRHVIRWFNAVDVQIHRMDDVIATKFQPATDAESAFRRMIQLDVDQYFFLLALNKLDRWLGRATKIDRDLKQPTKAFRSAVPNLKEVRDMWEHDEEYVLRDKGRDRSKYVRAGVGGHALAADATMLWTSPEGLKHVIGGRFDVQNARAALAGLAQHVYAAAIRVGIAGAPRDESGG